MEGKSAEKLAAAVRLRNLELVSMPPSEDR